MYLKVLKILQPVPTDLEQLNGGCIIEDAMDIKAPEMHDQLAKWKVCFLYVGLCVWVYGLI